MINKNKWLKLLPIVALGVVFGDLGTSPLYVLNTAFSKTSLHIAINKTDIFGICSLIIWSLILVVSLEYVHYLMRTTNAGDGGSLALVGLIKKSLSPQHHRYRNLFILLGLIGLALYLGDSTITPAISVLSAVGGLSAISTSFSSYIIPITLIVIVLLFLLQTKGTSLIGDFFGPLMLIWFLFLTLGGLIQLSHYPTILLSIWPGYAVSFIIRNPILAFVALSAVVLAITGAEALYADIGHFGRQPIKKAWFYVVLPAVVIGYLGESALILTQPLTVNNPYVYLFPVSWRFLAVIIATIATVIASQSVISGAFSMVKQAIQLDYLPKLKIKHTSDNQTGQVYINFINISLFIAVVFLVIFFKSATNLANAYGIAVSGTILNNGLLYIYFKRAQLEYTRKKTWLVGLTIVSLPVLFFIANLTKFLSGGWFPLGLALVIFMVIHIYSKAENLLKIKRRSLEMPLAKFASHLNDSKAKIRIIDGVAIYVGHHRDLTPLALQTVLKDFIELYKTTIVVTVEVIDQAYIPVAQRLVEQEVFHELGSINYLHLQYGYHDIINLPNDLKNYLTTRSLTNFNYFISLSDIVLIKNKAMPFWQKRFFRFMFNNTSSITDYYHLPTAQTVQIKTPIEL